MRGVDRHTWWEQECLKRSPDDFDLYIYNDFGGYGAMEVLENIVSTLYMHGMILLGLTDWYRLPSSTLSSNQSPPIAISGLKLKDLP